MIIAIAMLVAGPTAQTRDSNQRLEFLRVDLSMLISTLRLNI